MTSCVASSTMKSFRRHRSRCGAKSTSSWGKISSLDEETTAMLMLDDAEGSLFHTVVLSPITLSCHICKFQKLWNESVNVFTEDIRCYLWSSTQDLRDFHIFRQTVWVIPHFKTKLYSRLINCKDFSADNESFRKTADYSKLHLGVSNFLLITSWTTSFS